MEDLRIPVHLHVERSTGIVRLTHGKTDVELMKMRCDLSAFGTFTRLDPSGNYEADNYWIGIKPDDSTVFHEGLFDPKRHLVIDHAYYRVVEAKQQSAELNWILDVRDIPYTGQSVMCTTYNAETPYGVATILVYTLNDAGVCEQHIHAKVPWNPTFAHYIKGSLSDAMDYVKDAVTNKLKGNV